MQLTIDSGIVLAILFTTIALYAIKSDSDVILEFRDGLMRFAKRCRNRLRRRGPKQ